MNYDPITNANPITPTPISNTSHITHAITLTLLPNLTNPNPIINLITDICNENNVANIIKASMHCSTHYIFRE